MTYRPQTGVTLIELLVTLSIAVILMTIAVPGFQDFFRRNRVESAASEFMATLNYARSEAIRRGVRVSVCRSNTGSNCTTTEPWNRGWIVFTNPDNDNNVDTGEEILRVYQGLPNAVTLNSDFTNRITYQSDGRITNNVGGSFFFCHGSPTDARRIVIIGTGRARIEPSTSCS
jgi:type IV fimbrial biogenesis protein FimT